MKKQCDHNFIFSHTEAIQPPSSSTANFTEYVDIVVCSKCGKIIRQKQNEEKIYITKIPYITYYGIK